MATPVPNELLIGHRMNADKAFAGRLNESDFSRTEWDLIMSVVSFEIDDPEKPETANLRPVIENLDDAIAAADEVPKDDTSGPYSSGDTSSEGLFDRLTGLFSGGKSSGDRRREAEALVNEYTATLQEQLKEHDRWESVCEQCVEAE